MLYGAEKRIEVNNEDATGDVRSATRGTTRVVQASKSSHRDDSTRRKDACQRDMKNTGLRVGEEMDRATCNRKIIRYLAILDHQEKPAGKRRRHAGLTCCKSVRRRRPLSVQHATQCAESDGASFPDPHRHYQPAQCTLGMKHETLKTSTALNPEVGPDSYAHQIRIINDNQETGTGSHQKLLRI